MYNFQRPQNALVYKKGQIWGMPSSCPCQWVSEWVNEWVIDSFRLKISIASTELLLQKLILSKTSVSPPPELLWYTFIYHDDDDYQGHFIRIIAVNISRGELDTSFVSLNNDNNAASGLSVKNIIAHCTVANYCLSSILLHTVAKLQNIICHANVAKKTDPTRPLR